MTHCEKYKTLLDGLEIVQKLNELNFHLNNVFRNIVTKEYMDNYYNLRQYDSWSNRTLKLNFGTTGPRFQ